MSQAAVLTKPAPRAALLRRVLPLLATSVVAPVIIVSVAGRGAWSYWGEKLAHLQLHAPNFALLAEVARTFPLIIVHMSCALLALAIGTVMLIGVKGTKAHRVLGYTWAAAMGTTAATSLFIKTINPGHWSFIHFLSGWTIIALPVAIAMARRKNVRRHARMTTSLFVGGLLIAGLFTFLPGRLMYQVFFG